MDIKYVLGLIEGEGHFHYKPFRKHVLMKNGTIKEYHIMSRSLQIIMHIRDVELLNIVKTTLGMGSVTIYPRSAKPFVCYRISNRRDLLKLIEIIDSNDGFFGNRKQQYEEWKPKIINEGAIPRDCKTRRTPGVKPLEHYNTYKANEPIIT